MGRRMAQPEAERRPPTLQAITEIELPPTDLCADCGERLLDEQEVKDQA